LNQINNEDDDRNDEQEMDQTTANVADEAKEPEHNQDDNYSPEHGYLFLSIELNFRRPIYPKVRLFAKLFENIEKVLLPFRKDSGPQGKRNIRRRDRVHFPVATKLALEAHRREADPSSVVPCPHVILCICFPMVRKICLTKTRARPSA
jgi:hypothetical protein